MRQLLFLIQLLAIIVAAQSLPRHWKRAPVRGTFNVDLYAFNKPRMNLARQEGGKVLPMVQLLEQLSHSSRSTMPKSHYRNLDGTIEADTNSSLSTVRANLYSNEFLSQNVGSKKIVKLNTLADGKPVRENIEEQEEPLKVKLPLPEAAETATTVSPATENSSAKTNETIEINTVETVMEMKLLESMPTETPLKQTDDGQQTDNDREVKSTAKPLRMKSKRKQSKAKAKTAVPTTMKTKTQNETETTMAANLRPASATPSSPSSSPSSPPSTSSSHVKEPGMGLATQSPEISTHRPTEAVVTVPTPARKGSKTKTKRRGSQRRPTKEEIETTTNWWQILPYAEIRTFLNTIYDSITDDDDERAGGMSRSFGF
ncbi:myb-like protein V [Drosophila tropicalis]|uniref:myb-like protein V n=1 Tax=Drosophila tropicalis TaxID=46794 RepID=UPI0035ABE0B8